MPCSADLPIACDLNALSSEDREQRRVLAEATWSAARDVRELADGYAVRLPSDPDSCRRVTELMLLERRCCPFFHLAMELEANDGPLWIRLTGGPGVKDFLTQIGIASLAPRHHPACCG